MPAKLIWKDTYFIIKYSGVTKLSDILNIYDHLSSSSKYDKANFLLVDCRELEKIKYSEKDYQVHAAFGITLEAFFGRVSFKGAVVVSSKEIEDQVKKLLQTADNFDYKWKRKIFYDYEEALEWAKSDNLGQQS